MATRHLGEFRWFVAQRFGALLGSAVLVMAAAAAGPALAARTEVVLQAEDLMVVDCLLPGQVRRLGGQAQFLSARRPVRTTQSDCAIRGGEYVAFDRADYRTALQVWSGPAESGDADAQNYVGEIYLKGLGTEPDPVQAAQWFEKAAAQGHSRAQANLGLLYELGQGVRADPLKALNLFRDAAGGSDELLFASAVQVEFERRDARIAEQSAEIAALKSQIEALKAELAERRSVVAGLQAEASQLRSRLAEVRERAGASDGELQAQRSRIEQQAQELQSLRERLAAQRAALARREAESKSLAQVEAEDAAALAEQQQRLQSAVQGGQSAVSELETRIGGLEATVSSDRAAYTARIEALEAQLAERAKDDWQLMKLLEGQLAQRESRLREQTLEIAQLQQQVSLRGGDLLASVTPRLEVISPSLSLTRSGGGAAVRSAPGRRPIVGRVSTPQLVERLTINQLPVVLADNGLFRASVEVPPEGTEVRIEATSRRGEVAELSFSLLPIESGSADSGRRGSRGAGRSGRMDLGDYHALVIGNNSYADSGFPALGSAVNDATAVAQLLRERYGHQTRLLLNASRLDILSALAELRSSLKPEDNLLVYYAGHGELSEDGSQGYWIPVDARAGEAGTWIANRAISDLLESLPARHVMVVADSCYAGALTGAALPTYAAAEPGADWAQWVRAASASRSRLALTSGGLQPVPDSGSGRHSYFARAFLNVLQDNNQLIEGARVYREVNSALALAALDAPLSQVPQYAPIQFAGHEAGEFFLQPKR